MNWLDRTLWEEPIWLTGLVYLALLLLAAWLGVALGRRRGRDPADGASVSTVQAAVLGLLALLLAFTYSLAANRFDLRRRLLVEEANAIGTVWLRASFLPEPERRATRAEPCGSTRTLRVMPEEARFSLAAGEGARAGRPGLADRDVGRRPRGPRDPAPPPPSTPCWSVPSTN